MEYALKVNSSEFFNVLNTSYEGNEYLRATMIFDLTQHIVVHRDEIGIL